MKSWKTKIYILLGLLVLLALITIPTLSVVYVAYGGKTCARCHEIRSIYNAWNNSAHRNVECKECHGSIFTLNLHFHLKNVQQFVRHINGDIPEQIKIKSHDVRKLVGKCQSCHQQAFAAWKAGPHSVNYAEIYTDNEHNTKRRLNDHCFLCHGMYFEGSIDALVTPVSLEGPWQLLDEDLADEPAIPCLACHQIHTHGETLESKTYDQEQLALDQSIHTPSLGFYDRRTKLHYKPENLPIPEMKFASQNLQVSQDNRQTLCYQCHAPMSTFQSGSGDDRTCRGVHEGISCLACHQGHDQNTRASCDECHPQLSNCGLDVKKMDTTFASKSSKHNIHFVQCIDCHPQGTPVKEEIENSEF